MPGTTFPTELIVQILSHPDTITSACFTYKRFYDIHYNIHGPAPNIWDLRLRELGRGITT
jgi:hypothetical protein